MRQTKKNNKKYFVGQKSERGGYKMDIYRSRRLKGHIELVKEKEK